MAGRLLRLTILVLIALTPIFNVNEVAAYVSGVVVDQRFASTPVALKLVKDLGLGLIAVLAAFGITPQARRAARFAIPFALAVALSLAFTLARSLVAGQGLAQAALVALAGLRWIFPFAVAWLLIGQIDGRLMRQIALVLAVLLLADTALQIYESLYTLPGWGFNTLGLSFRPPGFFITGNSAAFLAALAAWAAYFFLKGSPLRGLVLLLAPVGILLSSSGAGIIAFGGFVFLVVGGGRYLRVRLILAPALAAVVLIALPAITGRRDLIDQSLLGRARLLSSAANESALISDRFGAGTNVAVLLRNSTETGVATESADIVDSTYTSVLANTGWLGLATFLGLLVLLWYQALRAQQLDYVTFLAIYTVMAFSTIVSEAFPMNLLLAVGVGYFAAGPVPEPAPSPGASRPARAAQWAIAIAVIAAIVVLLAPLAPYEYALARGQDALEAEKPADADANLQTAVSLLPRRPTAYGPMTRLAAMYAGRGDWADALRLARQAGLGAPLDPRVARELANLFRLFATQTRAMTDVRQLDELVQPASAQSLIELGDIASATSQYGAALTFYRLAQGRGTLSHEVLQRLATAHYATGDAAGGLAAYRAMATAPRDPATAPSPLLGNPRLRDALDFYTSAACLDPARRPDVGARMEADRLWLVRIGDAALSQSRWADADACYRLDAEVMGQIPGMPPDAPDLQFRKGLAAALAQTPAAEEALARVSARDPSFGLVRLGAQTTLDGTALRWLRAPSAGAPSAGAPFAPGPTGVFTQAGEIGALVLAAEPGTFELSAELRQSGTVTPSRPVTFLLGLDGSPLLTHTVAADDPTWNLAAAAVRLEPGYHLITIRQAGPAPGGAVRTVTIKKSAN